MKIMRILKKSIDAQDVRMVLKSNFVRRKEKLRETLKHSVCATINWPSATLTMSSKCTCNYDTFPQRKREIEGIEWNDESSRTFSFVGLDARSPSGREYTREKCFDFIENSYELQTEKFYTRRFRHRLKFSFSVPLPASVSPAMLKIRGGCIVSCHNTLEYWLEVTVFSYSEHRVEVSKVFLKVWFSWRRLGIFLARTWI